MTLIYRICLGQLFWAQGQSAEQRVRDTWPSLSSAEQADVTSASPFGIVTVPHLVFIPFYFPLV